MEHISAPLARVIEQVRKRRASMTPAQKAQEAHARYLNNPTKGNLGMFVAFSDQADQAEIENGTRNRQRDQLSKAKNTAPCGSS
jgi:hypothetical protein